MRLLISKKLRPKIGIARMIEINPKIRKHEMVINTTKKNLAGADASRKISETDKN